jgi:uncharacterized protein
MHTSRNMIAIPTEIVEFLASSRVATVCFNNEKNIPYCVPCFYVFDSQHRLLLFKSSHGAYHEDYIRAVSKVAGSVLPGTFGPGNIKGVQFTGTTLPQAEIAGLRLEENYHNEFPSARAMQGYVWAVRPEFIKFTDNTRGFGHKTTWRAFHAEATSVTAAW